MMESPKLGGLAAGVTPSPSQKSVFEKNVRLAPQSPRVPKALRRSRPRHGAGDQGLWTWSREQAQSSLQKHFDFKQSFGLLGRQTGLCDDGLFQRSWVRPRDCASDLAASLVRTNRACLPPTAPAPDHQRHWQAPSSRAIRCNGRRQSSSARIASNHPPFAG